MKIKTFTQYILNEGAYIDNDAKVNLNFDNIKANSKEVLKTLNKDYHMTLQKGVGFKLCVGLDYSPFDGIVDHPGRFKATMDYLKAGKIKDNKQAIYDFLDQSYLTYDITDVDYIITTESSKDLNEYMTSATKKIFPNAKIIKLKKLEFENPGLAINWKELEYQVNQQSINTAYRFMSDIKGMLVYNPDFPTFRPSTMMKHIKKCKTVKEVKKTFEEALKTLKWKVRHSDGKPLVPFKMRSSGFLSRDSLRDFFYPKYDFKANDYSNAVIDCIIDGNKKMLFIDDNINSGLDMEGIGKDINKAALELGIKDLNYKNNFIFYALYTMSEKSQYRTATGFTYEIEGVSGFYDEIGKTPNYVISFENFIGISKEKHNPLNLSRLAVDEKTAQKLEMYRRKEEANRIKKETEDQEQLNRINNISQKIESNFGKNLLSFFTDELEKYDTEGEKRNSYMKLVQEISKLTGEKIPFLNALYYKNLKDLGLNTDKDFWPYDKEPLIKI